ncbi:MAG TPA: glycosyltransferase family 4 protein [Candidatus Bathyarchaeia archaeon]|nr:glycosyltransferase family 4 protein [Candidatus Bathyarchaeia archaeon]
MVTPFYYPVIGGTESFIQNASLRLNEIGIKTDVLTFNLSGGDRPVWKNIIVQMDKSKIIKIRCLKAIRPSGLLQIGLVPGPFQRFMKEYDIIHFHNETELSLPLFSYFVKKPKIMHCHCLDVSYRFYKKNPASCKALRKISHVYVAVSDPIRRLLIDLGIPKNNIRIVPNGVDTEIFRPNNKLRARNLLLFVGRIVPNKGLHILLKSLEYVKSPVTLVIIGPRSSFSPAYYDEILRYINRLNETTTHKISFLGVQTKEELIRWYQRATIFVCPSLSEPFGIVNLEAMSCGTPVIASSVGGIPEVVKNNKNGILVRCGVSEELAHAIQSLLDNRDLRNAFSEDGREWVVKNFSSQVIARYLLRLYNSMLLSA